MRKRTMNEGPCRQGSSSPSANLRNCVHALLFLLLPAAGTVFCQEPRGRPLRLPPPPSFEEAPAAPREVPEGEPVRKRTLPDQPAPLPQRASGGFGGAMGAVSLPEWMRGLPPTT